MFNLDSEDVIDPVVAKPFKAIIEEISVRGVHFIISLTIIVVVAKDLLILLLKVFVAVIDFS